MEADGCRISFVKVNEERVIARTDILSLLKTYNCYHEGRSFQLRSREQEEGGLVIEGLLNISWGLRRPIRLQMQDGNGRFRYPRAGPWRPEPLGVARWAEQNHEAPGVARNENTQKPLQKQTSLESNNNSNEIPPPAQAYSDVSSSEEDTPQLLRTQSDASFMDVQRRSKLRSAADLRRVKRHRFSINGHFYNHETSVFTPAHGSVTNVRVSSAMTTLHVLNLLLNKFRVENELDEFGLYMVHESGERTKLKDTEYPLISRILHGPCEKIAKIFLMETDLGEEVTYDVAQYIKFEMPVLTSFVEKLREEEEREVSKLTRKYSALKSMVLQQLEHVCERAEGV